MKKYVIGILAICALCALLFGLYFVWENNFSDKALAEECFTKASEGLPAAQSNLGLMYFYGRGVPQDYKKAFEWFTKAAEQGDANAQNILGVMYGKGQDVPQNYKKAFEWFTKAAVQGYSVSQYNLGCMYEQDCLHADSPSTPKDLQKAFEWTKKAAEQGVAAAQNNLGYMYGTGNGVPQDCKKSIEWYTKAAEKGLPEAQYNLGSMHESVDCHISNRCVPQDYKKAIAWYTKVAAHGGRIVSTPPAEWNMKAASQYLGGGHHIPKEYRITLSWVKKAANLYFTESRTLNKLHVVSPECAIYNKYYYEVRNT